MKKLILIIVMGGTFLACQKGLSEAEIAKMIDEKVEIRIAEVEAIEQANINAIKNLLKGFSTGNTEQIAELVHEDFKNHHAPEGLQDRAGFGEIVKQVSGIFGSFDQFDLKPIHLFAKGDYVAMMDGGTGMKNGQEYKHVDIHIFKMKDGKMYEHWNSFGLPSQRDILMNFLEQTK